MLGRLCPRFLISVLILVLAIAVSAQAPPPVTTSGTTSDPSILTNKSVTEMVAAKLPEEVIITKIQTSKANFDLSTPALVELNSSGVSANIVKAMMTLKSASPAPEAAKVSPPPPDPNDPNSAHDSGIYAYTEKTSGKKMILLEPTVYTQGKSGARLRWR